MRSPRSLDSLFNVRAAKPLALAALLFAAGCVPGAARGQELVLPPQPAPPPMKFVPEVERAQLNAARDAKARVRATLDLLEQRLARAEQSTAAARFDPAAAELGVYQALIEDVIEYLRPVGRSPDGQRVDSSTRDLYKRIELTLNKHTARIETMRRLTPSEAQGNVRDAFVRTRELRTEALNAFFGNTVLPEPPPPAGEVRPGQPVKNESPKPPTSH